MNAKRRDLELLVRNRDWEAVRDVVARWPVADVADLLASMPKADMIMLYRSLPRLLASEVFAYLDVPKQDSFLADLSDDEARSLLRDLAPDDRTTLFEELPAAVTQRMLELLDPSDLAEARELLGYPEDSLGRLMTPDYVSVRAGWNVKRTMEEIRRKGRDSETINSVYVTDVAGRLVGSVSLRELVLARPDDPVRGLMRTPPLSMAAFRDQEEAARTMERYDLWALPVVDSQGVLLGIVTGDDLFLIAEEETTEDFHKAAGISPLHTPFKDAKPTLLYRSRVAWLLALAAMTLLSGPIIASYQDVMQKALALVFFLPLLIDSAGNAGSQSATLMVRALAMGDVRPCDWVKILGRELWVSSAVGGTMGVVVWGVAAFRTTPLLGLVTAASLMIVVMAASMIGVIVPYVFHKLHIDPAAASSPLISSIADIIGVLIYFGLARLALGL